MPDDTRIGSELAGYRIVSVAGRGGMGVVYVAEDSRLGRRVALKLLSPELVEDERFRDRFVRESRLAASIEHRHIVPIYAAGDADGTLFIAMRYIQGTDLGTLLAEHATLEPARAADLVRQVAEALDAAHERGLVHRDVKPANVLVETRGGHEHAYLTDFGLTKQASSVSGLTATGQLVGTIDYLSPEQINGKPADGRSDQYALACVLYQCLTGVPPFARESGAATLWAHVRDAPPSIRDAHPAFASDLDPVMGRALAKQPDERYATCEHFAAAAGTAIGVASATEPPIERRRFPMVVLAVALVLAMAVAIAALATRGGGGTAAPPVYHLHLERLDLSTGRIVGAPVGIPGRDGNDLVAGTRHLYVADSLGLVAFDPRSSATIVRPRPGGAYSLAVGGGRVWLFATDPTGSSDGLVYGYDEFGLSSPTIGHIPSPWLTAGRSGGKTRQPGLATAAGAVWTPTYEGVLSFDQRDVTTRHLIRLPLAGHFLTAARASDVWTPFTTPGEVIDIDAIHGRLRPPIRFHTGAPIVGIAYAQGALWVAVASSRDPATPNLFEINAGSGRTFEHTRLPGNIAWFAGSRSTLLAGYYPDNGSAFTVATIDPSGHIKTVKRFGTAVTGATISGNAAWLLLGQ